MARNVKRGRCCHRPRFRFRPGSLDPGRFPIGFCKSKLQQGPIRDGPKQAPRHPFRLRQSKLRLRLFGRLSGEPATILERLSGKPATIPMNILPASRRLSILRLFSTGRTRLPDRPFLSGRTLRGRCGRPFEQALRAAFRDSLARRLRSRRTPEKWVRLKVSPLPRASFRLPHQSVPGLLPEGYRPSRHWRRLEFLPRCRLVTPDREMPS